jgi:hypothetical protein
LKFKLTHHQKLDRTEVEHKMFEKRVDGPAVTGRQARWKWRRKPLERLNQAMEMARSEVGGR